MLKDGLYVKREVIIKIFKYLLVVMIGFIMIAPFYWLMTSSFKTLVEAERIPPTLFPRKIVFDSYKLIFTLLPFHMYILNSLFVCTAATLLKAFSSWIGGYIFAKFNFKGKNTLFYLLLAGMMIPFQITIIPLYVLLVDLSLGDTLTALIIVGYFDIFTLFIARQYIHSIPDAFIDAALIEGASHFTIWSRIIVPLCKAPIIALFALSFLAKWNSLLFPLIVLNTPEKFTLTLGLASLTQSEFRTDVVMSLAAATVAVLPLLVIFFIAQKQIKGGIGLTSMK